MHIGGGLCSLGDRSSEETHQFQKGQFGKEMLYSQVSGERSYAGRNMVFRLAHSLAKVEKDECHTGSCRTKAEGRTLSLTSKDNTNGEEKHSQVAL